MKFKIHRGTKEIGGTCVEVWTDKTRILVDFGMPLVNKDGSEFDFRDYAGLSFDELISRGVLPDVKGAYSAGEPIIDGVIISHPHQDHYGLYDYLSKDVKCYIGKATHKILELNNIFTSQSIIIPNPHYFEKESTFQIGDISITPYWADHSAFDSHSFLIESGGKTIFYSGDFRGHGRKSKAFNWFTHNAPTNIDYLLLEGTSIGRGTDGFKTERVIEKELIELFSEPGKTNLIYTSGQNIDRLVSIYRACLQTDKIFVVDVYVATILKELSEFAKIPFPSEAFLSLRVLYPYYTSNRLKREGNENILYQFKNYKITKEEISNHHGNKVIIIRPSMRKDLDRISGIDGGNFVFSMWEGYLAKMETKNFVDYLKTRKFTVHKIHTSGHADVSKLKELVAAVNPKNIVPIHTFAGDEYQNIFGKRVVNISDGKTIQISGK